MNNTKQIIDNHNKRILHSSYSSYTKDNKDGTRNNKIHMGSLTVSGRPLGSLLPSDVHVVLDFNVIVLLIFDLLVVLVLEWCPQKAALIQQ